MNRKMPGLNFGLKVSKPSRGIPRGSFSKSKYAKMNWEQVKKRFPGLDPNSDIDFDGTRNSKDCKPLDPAKDGPILYNRLVNGYKYGGGIEKRRQMERDLKKAGRFKKSPRAGRIIGRKIEKVVGKVIAPISPTAIKKRLERVAGKRKSVKIYKIGRRLAGLRGEAQEDGRGPGRPRGVYKHRNPITGKPIPATQYYKVLKAMRRRAKTTAEQSQVQQQMAMARRGIPPQLSRQVIAQRQAMLQQQVQPQEGMTEIQQRMARVRALRGQQVPIQIQQMQMPQQRFRVKTDLMTGRKMIEQLPPREKWTY